MKTIHPKHIPMKPPLFQVLVIYLLLDHFQASDLVRGIVATNVVFYVILCFFAWLHEDYRDVVYEEKK